MLFQFAGGILGVMFSHPMFFGGVGSQVMATSLTMFANPQVTLARMFTDTVSGIRSVDGLVFMAVQVVGALVAYLVWRKLLWDKRA